jgi:predicted peptidase
MNRHVLTAVLFGVLVATVAAEDMGIQNQKKKTFNGRSAARRFKAEYLVFLPQEYDKDKKKTWPVILFLHGAGERGKDIAKVTVHGPPKIVKSRPEFPFIVISPQCPPDETWSDETLLGLLDEVVDEYRVDRTRVYLTGLSMGGYGTWSVGLRHPERFAAIAPICGGGDILPVLLPPRGKETVLKRLPVWVFHGAKDNLVPLSESERMVNALKRIGNENVKLTVYPEAGHDSWTETYENEQFYDWLLQQKNPTTARKKRGNNAE